MIKVGWTCVAQDAGILFDPPEPIAVGRAGDVGRCPSVQDALRNTWVLKMAFDLSLTFGTQGPQFSDLVEGKAPHFNPDAIRSFIQFNGDPGRWREPSRPIIQIKLPYAFFSDDPGVFLTETAPHQHLVSWPGVVIPGEMNIYDWPARVLNFAFEWHDTSRKLELKRGDPLCYLKFSTPKQETVKLVEVAMHADLSKVMSQIREVASFGSGTRCLFAKMAKRRPRRLIR